MLVKKKIIYVDEERYRTRCESILRNVGNLRLTGETGTGKSTLVYHLCQENDWELHEYQLSTDTSRWDLLAQDILVPEVTAKGIATKSALRLGVVCKWLLGPYEPVEKGKPERKQVLFLDEFNYAQPQVLTLLNSLCDFRDSIHVPELVDNADMKGKFPNLDDEGNIKRIKGKHLLIIAMNPAEKAQYVGTIGMNIAQLRRFESVEVKYLSWEGEKEAIFKAMPDVDNTSDYAEVNSLLAIGTHSRSKYRLGEIGNPITTANILNYLKMYKDKVMPMLPDEVRLTILSMYKETEQDAVKAIFATADEEAKKNKEPAKGKG